MNASVKVHKKKNKESATGLKRHEVNQGSKQEVPPQDPLFLLLVESGLLSC